MGRGDNGRWADGSFLTIQAMLSSSSRTRTWLPPSRYCLLTFPPHIHVGLLLFAMTDAYPTCYCVQKLCLNSGEGQDWSAREHWRMGVSPVVQYMATYDKLTSRVFIGLLVTNLTVWDVCPPALSGCGGGGLFNTDNRFSSRGTFRTGAPS
jgi:hypothetical protein